MYRLQSLLLLILLAIFTIDCQQQQQQSTTTSTVRVFNPYLSENEKVELKQIFDLTRIGVKQVYKII
jgi:hypothetical protein